MELLVAEDEAGQKLLQFLIRRLGLPEALLHRWIRQGQVRLNKGRIKPFAHVRKGDQIRLPPFAGKMAEAEKTACNNHVATDLPPLAASFPGILIFDKPAGLPAHGGTGHSQSLASILEEHFSENQFRPALVHRLDKDTSGLIMAATSYSSLRELQTAIAERNIIKEYLAWVEGRWNLPNQVVLTHKLEKKFVSGREKVYSGTGKEAVSQVKLLERREFCSLLQIKLLTGRTHQIRAQLAAEGHPLCGDVKYGACPPPGLFLHAARLIMPDKTIVETLPPWKAERKIRNLPPPLC